MPIEFRIFERNIKRFDVAEWLDEIIRLPSEYNLSTDKYGRIRVQFKFYDYPIAELEIQPDDSPNPRFGAVITALFSQFVPYSQQINVDNKTVKVLDLAQNLIVSLSKKSSKEGWGSDWPKYRDEEKARSIGPIGLAHIVNGEVMDDPREGYITTFSITGWGPLEWDLMWKGAAYPEIKTALMERLPSTEFEGSTAINISNPSTEEAQSNVNLQRVIQPDVAVSGSFVEASDADALIRFSRSVCLIEAPDYNKERGTGFLIGPRLVLTNYHVVDSVSVRGDLNHKATKLVFRFGFKGVNTEVKLGQTFRIDTTSPVLAFSHHTSLDYTLLQLVEDPLDENKAPIEFLSVLEDINLEENEPVWILQHPEGQSLKFARGQLSSIEESGQRFRYTTNTLNGSSGSPVFDRYWHLIGLHHGGPDGTVPGNRGIPITAIWPEIQPFIDEAKSKPTVKPVENPCDLSELALNIAEWLYKKDDFGQPVSTFSSLSLLKDFELSEKQLERILQELKAKRLIDITEMSGSVNIHPKPRIPLAIVDRLDYDIRVDMLRVARVLVELEEDIEPVVLQEKIGLALPRLNRAILLMRALGYVNITPNQYPYVFRTIQTNYETYQFVEKYKDVELPN